MIGHPEQFDNYADHHFNSIDHELQDAYSRAGLMLDDQQQTDIWVNAGSIPDFTIFFYRNALKLFFLGKYLEAYNTKAFKVILVRLDPEFKC